MASKVRNVLAGVDGLLRIAYLGAVIFEPLPFGVVHPKLGRFTGVVVIVMVDRLEGSRAAGQRVGFGDVIQFIASAGGNRRQIIEKAEIV